MSNADRTTYLGMSLLSLVFFIGAIWTYQNNRMKQSQPGGVILHVDPSSVIGSLDNIRGDKNRGYTLVEFGDYECPPCHAANIQLQQVLARYREKVNFTFHNYPLTSIHQNAYRAALIAEAAREQGKFWQVHDSLYTEPDICSVTLDRIELTSKLDLHKAKKSYATTAKQAIERDITFAKSIGIDGTPTFILCEPSGQVVRLRSVKDISTYVRPN